MKLYIITGEPSGDMHAANLVSELKKEIQNIQIRAWGGDKLIKEDVQLVRHIKETSFMGFYQVLKNINLIRKNLAFCKKDILTFKPDAIVLIDYPGFNLRIAKFAKKNSIKVYYYIPPKVWAWNENRINKIRNIHGNFHITNGSCFLHSPFSLESFQHTRWKFTIKG